MPAPRQTPPNGVEAGWMLLDGAGYGREHVVGVRAYESDRSDDEYKDYGQHDRVFGNVLTLVIFQEERQTAHWGILPFCLDLPEAGR